jgi:hypothetical protein
MRSLWGWTTGFAVPRYIITSPVGKVSLEESQTSSEHDNVMLHGWAGDQYAYSDIQD